MEIQKHTGEKLEDYFSRLVAEGFEFDASYQNITLADIESVLRRLNQFSNDKRDVIWSLLNSAFPSPFANPTGYSIADGASIAQIGCYVGILMRHGGKLDREGRDYWVKPLIDEIAAIERVTFSDGVFVSGHLKAKSPNSAYRLTDAFKRLLVSVETDHFAESLEEYIRNVDQRLAVFAELERASRENIGISGHKRLIQDSINVYAQTFLPGYIPLFTDFADGDRVTEEERAALDQYGIVFGTIDDMWPDAILYNPAEEKLWFIEAVTSDGEADLHKVEGLQTICNNSGKIYGGTTTTYETWKCLASRQQSENNLAPGTYIWIRECPNKHFKVC